MVLAPRTSSLPKLRLKPGRWTVGSAATCSYRIAGEGVQPRHALVLCGGQTTVLKAWDSRTWHNGQPVLGEVRLQPGDRVTIGSVEFSIESDRPFDPAAVLSEIPRESVARSPAVSSTKPEPEGWDLERLREQIQELRDELSQRVMRRSEAVAAVPTPASTTAQDNDQTSARIAELEQSLAEAGRVSEQTQRELVATREQQAQRESELQQAAESMRLALEATQQELAELRRDQERQRSDAVQQEQAWQQHTAEWSAEREQWQEELVSLADAKQQLASEWEQRHAAVLDEIAHWKTECEQLRAGWQLQQAAWDDGRAKLQDELRQREEAVQRTLQAETQREHELAEQSQQLLADRQQFAAERQQFQAERLEHEQAVAALNEERQHVEQHADEVLAKFEELSRRTSELEQQQANLTREQQTLEHSWNWLQTDRRKLVEEKEEWQQQRAHWQAECERWIAESEQLQRDREEFAKARDLWHEQHTASQQRAVESEQLAAERRQFHAEQSAWAAQREQFEAECRMRDDELETAREELRSQQQVLHNEHNRLQTLRAELEARTTDLEREQASWSNTPHDVANSDWKSDATDEPLTWSQNSAPNEAPLSPLATLTDAWNIGVDLTEPRGTHTAERHAESLFPTDRTMPSEAGSHDDATSPTDGREFDSMSPEPLWEFATRPTSLDGEGVPAASKPEASPEDDWGTTETPTSENTSDLTSTPDVAAQRGPLVTNEENVPPPDTAKPVTALNAGVEPDAETATAPKAEPIISILESMAFADDEHIDDSVSRYMQHLLKRSQQAGDLGRERYIPAHSLKASAPSTPSANEPSGRLVAAESPFVVGSRAAKNDAAQDVLAAMDNSSDLRPTTSRLQPVHSLDKDAIRTATEHMRQVANQQTVENVEAANWKQIKLSIKSKLVLAGLSFVLSAGLLVWGYYEQPEFLILGVCASALGVMTWLDLILAIRQARTRTSRLVGRKNTAGKAKS